MKQENKKIGLENLKAEFNALSKGNKLSSRLLFDKECIMRNYLLNKEMAKFIINDSEDLLWVLPKELIDEEIVKIYENKSCNRFTLFKASSRKIDCYLAIPDDLKTEKLSYALAKNNCAYIEYIPERLKSKRICNLFDKKLYTFKGLSCIKREDLDSYLKRNRKDISVAANEINHLINSSNIDLVIDNASEWLGCNILKLYANNPIFKEEHLLKLISIDKHITDVYLPDRLKTTKVCEAMYKLNDFFIFKFPPEQVPDYICKDFVKNNNDYRFNQLKRENPELYKKLFNTGA